MAHRKLPLTAADRDRVVTLHPKLIISGRVTDAETGQPLPKCLIIQGVGFEGSDQISWSRLAGAEAFGREYVSTFDEPNDSMFLRVEAIGYQPAVSRAFRSSEGRQTVDFALQRADTISGVVLLPSGKPGDGVDVVFATEAKQVLLEMGRIEARTSAADRERDQTGSSHSPPRARSLSSSHWGTQAIPTRHPTSLPSPASWCCNRGDGSRVRSRSTPNPQRNRRSCSILDGAGAGSTP